MRFRLTLLYSGLFAASGLPLLALTDVLFQQRPGDTTVTVVPESELAADGRRGLGPAAIAGLAARVREDTPQQLWLISGMAAPAMPLVSVALGRWVAGRVLGPPHTISGGRPRAGTHRTGRPGTGRQGGGP